MVTNYEIEQAEYNALLNTIDAKKVLGNWKSLPSAPVTPHMNPEWLPPVLRDMAGAVAMNMNISFELPALIGLGVASSCACGRIAVQIKRDWKEPAQLFLLGIAASGEGKSPAFDKMTGQLFKSQFDENKQRYKRIEADKAELDVLYAKRNVAVNKNKDTLEARQIAEKIANFNVLNEMKRFITGDVTPEGLSVIMKKNDGATAILDDEGELFDLLSGRYQERPNLSPWLKGYTGSNPLTMERKSGSITIDHPNLAVLILAQPFIFSELFEERRMVGKGLLARFMVACPEPIREYSEEPDIPETVIQEYKIAVDRLLAIKPAILELTEEAKTLFFSWRNEVRQKQWEEWTALKKYEFIGKLAGNTARLACALKLWQDTDTNNPVNEYHMRNAISLARYFIGNLLHLIGTECTLSAPAKNALGLLVDNGQPIQKERDIKQKLRSRKLFSSADDIDTALDELAKAGYIQRAHEEGDGHTAAIVKVHPDLLPSECIEN